MAASGCYVRKYMQTWDIFGLRRGLAVQEGVASKVAIVECSKQGLY